MYTQPTAIIFPQTGKCSLYILQLNYHNYILVIYPDTKCIHIPQLSYHLSYKDAAYTFRS